MTTCASLWTMQEMWDAMGFVAWRRALFGAAQLPDLPIYRFFSYHSLSFFLGV